MGIQKLHFLYPRSTSAVVKKNHLLHFYIVHSYKFANISERKKRGK